MYPYPMLMICRQFYDFRYPYLILMVSEKINLTHRYDPNINLHGINGNKEVLHSPQSSGTRVSPPDAIESHAQDF